MKCSTCTSFITNQSRCSWATTDQIVQVCTGKLECDNYNAKARVYNRKKPFAVTLKIRVPVEIYQTTVNFIDSKTKEL